MWQMTILFVAWLVSEEEETQRLESGRCENSFDENSRATPDETIRADYIFIPNLCRYLSICWVLHKEFIDPVTRNYLCKYSVHLAFSIG